MIYLYTVLKKLRIKRQSLSMDDNMTMNMSHNNTYEGITRMRFVYAKDRFYTHRFSRGVTKMQSETLTNRSWENSLICNHSVRLTDLGEFKDTITCYNIHASVFKPSSTHMHIEIITQTCLTDWLDELCFQFSCLADKVVTFLDPGSHFLSISYPTFSFIKKMICSENWSFKSQINSEDSYRICIKSLICTMQLMSTQQASNHDYLIEFVFINRHVYRIYSLVA